MTLLLCIAYKHTFSYSGRFPGSSNSSNSKQPQSTQSGVICKKNDFLRAETSAWQHTHTSITLELRGVSLGGVLSSRQAEEGRRTGTEPGQDGRQRGSLDPSSE
uniref:(northern house mosquito) hypothetical protein n=1 Tax=Culex pipiens TaxID=7175 RepID=A0A8D8PI77_CULPI